MIKKIIVILFLTLGSALWRGADLFPDVSAQQRRPAPPSKFSKFKHSSHAGKVKSLINANQSIEIDCNYCHGAAVKDKLGKDQHDIAITAAYPSHKDGLANERTHSACTECHAFTGARFERDMCLICHDSMAVNPQRMKTNIRRFPNPDGGGVSQFYDYYSHSEHVDFFQQYAVDTPLKDRIKFFDAKNDAKVNKGLDKDRFECASCHTENQSPVSVVKINFAAGVKMSAPGHPECFVCHFDPKIVAPPKPDKPDPKNTFATNCTGCHQATGKPLRDGRPVKGSELAVLWFARQIVNTELNPAKPGVKSPLPYSHKTHDEAVGATVQDCLRCHVTGKSAHTRSDFYLEDRKSREKQPSAASCVECHSKEMQTVNRGAVRLETSKCNYCHSLATIREFGAKGAPLPPPNHFAGAGTTIAAVTRPPEPAPPVPMPPTPSPAPTPAPTPTPTPKPEPAPTPAPKPAPAPTSTPKPAPAATPAPTPAPTPKPEPAPTPAPAPTPTPAPAPNPAPAPTPTPMPPKPTPAPEPAPAPTTPAATPAAAPATSAATKPVPMGIIRLGDPKESPHWGQHAKWGVVENFNHGNHTKPNYSERCEDCHHTNKDSRVEEVLKCVTCHKEPDHPDTTKKGGGIDVEQAYHGVKDSENKANKAGCIECHRSYRDTKKPDTEAPISPCSACHTEKQARFDLRQLRPRRGDWVTEEMIALSHWLKSSRASARR